ncbi:hypothetical protein PPSIR1_01302 [Plesiocystis pacifica SIR-1]|uniref:Lipoprotein n=1 Tax=Plesiocystis pacifica SIR-1 TaxID=391625 RepID=A6G8B1_9BACT|nr:hypothetical protein [Plesiocystis pacifica]EDM77821.1 hypothetical protein PPSIR1_01302 [Plesiocystis pacifica SIR-1]
MRATRALSLGLPLVLVLSGCGDSGGSPAEGNADTDDEVGSSEDTSTSGGDTESSSSGESSETATEESASEESSSSEDEESSTESDTSTESSTDTGTETDTDTSTDTDTDTDTGDTETDTTGGMPIFGEWLLTSDTVGDAVRLLRIDLSEGQLGQMDVICDDVALPMEVPNLRFTSLAFLDNTLYAVRNQFLMIVDPCVCEAELVGAFDGSVAGIAVNANDVMYGVNANANTLMEIDPSDASTTLVTSFPFDVGNHGLTWSNLDVNELYFIEAQSDTLRVLDGSDPSMEKSVVGLSLDFGSVGAEMHPGNEVLYACSSSADLYSIDIQTGTVEVVTTMMGFDPPCGAIGAPWGPVDCVPQ